MQLDRREFLHVSALAAANAVVAQVYRGDPRDPARLFLDAFQFEEAAETNDLGGAVTWSVSDVNEGSLDDRNSQLSWSPSDPFNGMTHGDGDGFDRGVVFSWDGDAWYQTDLPEAHRDLSAFDFLSLSAAQGPRHPSTVTHDGSLGLGIALQDGAGVSASLSLEGFGLVTPVYPRTGLGAGAGWAGEMNTLRVPLRSFLSDGGALDLTDIRSVRILVGPAYGAPVGRIILDDIYLGSLE